MQEVYLAVDASADPAELGEAVRGVLGACEGPVLRQGAYCVVKIQPFHMRKRKVCCLGKRKAVQSEERIREVTEWLESFSGDWEEREEYLTMTQVLIRREARLLLMDAEDFAVFAAYLVQWFHTVDFFYRAEEGAAGEAAFREVRSVPLRGLRPAMFLDLPPETLLEITDKQHTDRRSAARSKTRSGRHDGKENGL